MDAAERRKMILAGWQPTKEDLLELYADRDHWQRMAAQYQIERDGLRRTLADILGMDRQHSAQGEREDGHG